MHLLSTKHFTEMKFGINTLHLDNNLMTRVAQSFNNNLKIQQL